ncbi:MAG: hypothetical protein Q7Q73_18945 [Verrucomicrobiota bacterium JB024]|nr:hypothetical protein [Verrucomicrobiota bacterium JB024]
MKRAELIAKLRDACDMASHYQGGYSGEFLDAQAFATALRAAVQHLADGQDDTISDLKQWFAPTCAWDDFVGTEGIRLGNEIYSALKTYHTHGLHD